MLARVAPTTPYTDEQIIDFLDEYMRGSDNPDFVGYREQSLTRDIANKAGFIRGRRKHAEIGGYKGKRILDVGCGFGWHAFTYCLIGNNDMVAMDILPSMIDGVNDCVRHMRAKGVPFKLAPVRGDICKNDFADASFDAIYSNEAIEHVHDIDAMLGECARILRPGGNIILINDCNVLNRKVREDITEMWHQRENDWKWSEYLRSIRPIEHGDAKPFAVRREEIIRAANPSLNDGQVAALVAATPGMLTCDIERLARGYKLGGRLPIPPELDWCRNPDTGEYAERLFDPFALMDKMRKAGFRRVQVRHSFTRWPLRYFNAVQFRPINAALFRLRPYFMLYGEK
jgi:ubiquinone/menaquinone biosynthesis C-methylase UbiE